MIVKSISNNTFKGGTKSNQITQQGEGLVDNSHSEIIKKEINSQVDAFVKYLELEDDDILGLNKKKLPEMASDIAEKMKNIKKIK